MYKMKYLSAWVVLVAALYGCADDLNYSETHVPSLEVHYIACDAPTNLFLQSHEDNCEMAVQSANTPWQISGMADWLSVSPKSGDNDQVVRLSAGQNPSGEDIRTTLFRLESKLAVYPYQKEFSLSQYASDPYVNMDISTLTISGSEYHQSYSVDSNIDWGVNSSNTSWLTAAKSSDGKMLTIHALANTGSYSRTGYIYLQKKANSSTLHQIKITQNVASMTIDNNESLLQYTNDGGSYQLQIASDADWNASTQGDWIEVNPDAGKTGNTTVTISTTPNYTESKRYGNVFFKHGNVLKSTIEIMQEGISMSLSQNSLAFDCSESSKTITVTANTDWQILSQPNWVVITPNEGKGDGAISIKALSNYSSEKREGTITVGKAGTTFQKTISVSQKAWVFENLIVNLNFDADAAKETVDLQVEGAWTAMTSHDWITVTPSTGNGNGQIEVAVKENTSANQRTGVVELTSAKTKLSISVAQRGKYFTVDGSQLSKTIGSRGGSHRMQFQTNENWTASHTATWATLSQTSGKGDVDVTLTVADNPSLSSREDTTTITPAYLQPTRVITRQDGRYLKVNVTRISFFKKGGTTDAYLVDTDADYTISTDDSWISITHDTTAHAFTVTVTENTAEDKRTGRVVVAMTNLRDGESFQVEIPVTQSGTAETLNIQNFGSDQNWNLGGDLHFNLKVTGYGSDENWNTGDNASFGVKVSGFGKEENWNYR